MYEDSAVVRVLENLHRFIKLLHANKMLRKLVAYVRGAMILIANC